MAHEEIFRELADAQAAGEMVAFHKWGDDPSIFLVGFVRDLSPTSATFELIAGNGAFDEVFKAPLRLIHSIDRGTLYLWRLKVLYEQGHTPDKDLRRATKPTEVRSLLEEAAREGFIVRIWTSVRDSDDCRVLSVGEETVVLTRIVDGGPAEGRTVVRLKRIQEVRYGEDERNDTLVHRYGLTHGFPVDSQG